MEEILDRDIAPKPNNESVIIYGKFWPRLGALILDTLIVGVPLFVIVYLNISWKNVGLLLVTNVLGMMYKPWMEYRYGATVGKMTLGLKVVDLNYDRPTLEAVLLRNVFSLSASVWSTIFSVLIFMSPEFQDV